MGKKYRLKKGCKQIFIGMTCSSLLLTGTFTLNTVPYLNAQAQNPSLKPITSAIEAQLPIEELEALLKKGEAELKLLEEERQTQLAAAETSYVQGKAALKMAENRRQQLINELEQKLREASKQHQEAKRTIW